MKTRFFVLVVLSLVLCLFSFSSAQVPQMINYQGKLKTDQGDLVDSTVSMEFRIYDDTLEGNVLWQEQQSSVSVVKGIFNVLLGSMNPITQDVFNGDARYLEVQVNSDVLVPRKAMVSVPYAFAAGAISSGCWDCSDPWTTYLTNLNHNLGIGTTTPNEYKLYVEGKDKGIYAVATEGYTVSSEGSSTVDALSALDGRPYAVVADVNTPNTVLTGGGYYTRVYTANVAGVDYLYGGNFIVNDDDISGNTHHIRGITSHLLNTGDDDYALELIADDPSYAVYAQGTASSYFEGNVGIGTTTPNGYKLYVEGKDKGIYAVATEGYTSSSEGASTVDALSALDGRPYAVVADVNTPNTVLTGGGYYTRVYTSNTSGIDYLYGGNFIVNDDDISGNTHHIRGITSHLLNTGDDDYALELVADDPSYFIYTHGTAKSYFEGSVGIGTTSPENKLHVTGAINLDPITTPATPSTGFVIYVDASDGKLKAKASTGAVTVLANP